MGIWNYDWEPYEIHTADGYTITVMHITKKLAGDTPATLNPLLMVPAMGSNPDSWIISEFANDPPTNPV